MIIRGNRLLYTAHLTDEHCDAYWIEPDEAEQLTEMIRDGFGAWALGRAEYLIESGRAVASKIMKSEKGIR